MGGDAAVPAAMDGYAVSSDGDATAYVVQSALRAVLPSAPATTAAAVSAATDAAAAKAE